MVLENKLGLTNSADLAREEERISKTKAIKMFETGFFDNLEAGKFEALSKIHKYLFEDIYEFAGEIRTENIAKGNFRFAPVMYLKTSLILLKMYLQEIGKPHGKMLKIYRG